MSESLPPSSVATWLKSCADCNAATPVESLWVQLLHGLDLIDSGAPRRVGEGSPSRSPLADTPPDTEPDTKPTQREALITALLDLTLKALIPACQQYAETCRSHLATELAALEQRYQTLDAQAAADPATEEAALHRMLVRLWFLQMLSVSLDGDVPVPHEDLLLYLQRLRMQFIGSKALDLLPQVERISLEALCARAATCVEQADALADREPEDSEQRRHLARSLVDIQRHCRRLYTLLMDAVTRCEGYRRQDQGEGQLAPVLDQAQVALEDLERAQFALIGQAITVVDALPDADEADAWLAAHSTAMIDFAEDTLSDIPDRDLQVQVPVLAAAYRRLHRYRMALLEPRRKRLKDPYRQIRRVERRLHNEWVEAGVSLALAQRHGPRFESRLDLMVLGLVLAAVVLLVFDLSGDLSAGALHVVIWLDTAICAGLMSDFVLRLRAAPDRRNFFRRHWFTDLLPSIPFAGLGFWFSSAASEAQGVVVLRFLRVAAVALRKARPLIQVARVFLFAARGMDRLARLYRHLLDWDILFFEPRPLNPIESLRVRGDRLGHRMRSRSNGLDQQLDAAGRQRVLERDLMLAGHLGHALQRVQALDQDPSTTSVARQIAIETVIDRLTHTDPHEIVEVLGVDFPQRLAKLEWVARIPPLRWLPGFSDVVAARRDTDNDLDFAETLARRLGTRLQGINDKVLFLSDLHGIITAPQFVDRIGATLINSMRRPRNRLLMLGAGFIVVTLLVEVLPFEWLESTAAWLRKTLGWPILILGVIAFVAVWFGNRLRSLAQTNTDFYTRIAEAKSINLLGDVKRAHAAEDQDLLARRVLRPEARIQGLEVSIHETASDAVNSDNVTDHFRNMVLDVFGRDHDGTAGSLAERVYLLYRDYLRGAHFDRGNTHTTDHLLGSPALLNLRHKVLRMGREELDALEDLDLRRSSGMAGPSLWLRFVTHAMTERVGQLVEEYNRHAIPIDERLVRFHSEQELSYYQHWLRHKNGLELNGDEPFLLTLDEDPTYTTTTFNALDFLSNDPARDGAIENRFGAEVLALVRGDRQRLIREVFGIPAIHRRAPQKRSFNPLKLYDQYLSRGRVFLLPLALLRLLAQALVLALRWFLNTLGQLRHPEPTRVVQQTDSFSDLRIALRKVHRMRKPVFLATTDLRTRVDVEYLGLYLPGEALGTLEGSTVFEDLDMIGASAEEQAVYQQIAEDRRRQMGELQAFLSANGLIGEALSARLELLFPDEPGHRRLEVMRAISAAYAADYEDIRGLVHGRQGLQALIADALAANGKHQTPGAAKRGLLRLIKRREAQQREAEFEAWWHRDGRWMLPGDVDPKPARKAVHRWWLADHQGLAHLIDLLGGLQESPQDAALGIIDAVTRNVSTWSEQLVTLRTVQALTILDIQSTTHIVRGLGRYTEDGDGEAPEVRVTML